MQIEFSAYIHPEESCRVYKSESEMPDMNNAHAHLLW